MQELNVAKVKGVKSKGYYIEVPGGKVWAIRYQSERAKGKTPLVVVHGGPGVPHNSELALAKIATQRPVIFYDQLGCGKSDNPQNPKLWRLQRFIQELDAIISYFKFARVHLFGHSWGGALACAYALKHPSKLLSLTLASPVLNSQVWVKDAKDLRAKLPKKIQDTLKKHEIARTMDSEEYFNATMYFYRKHVCRLDPWPDELLYSFEHINFPMYVKMWGYTEFFMCGNLKNLDLIKKLPKLKIPVLLTCGKYDEARPATMRMCLEKLQDGELKIFTKSSHMAIFEEQKEYVQTLKNFLKRVEKENRI